MFSNSACSKIIDLASGVSAEIRRTLRVLVLIFALLGTLDGPITVLAVERQEWGAGVNLSFPVVGNASFMSRMDIIPYFYLAPEESTLKGQNISVLIEPKMIFRVNLENGRLQSTRFKIGTKAVVKDVRLEADPIIVVSPSGQAIVFDAQTLIPRLNGFTHQDLSRVLETGTKNVLEEINGSPTKVDVATHDLISAHCQEAIAATHAPIDTAMLPLDVLAHREPLSLGTTHGVRAVFDEESRRTIERAWLQGAFEDPSILESFPNLQLELLFPWRTE